MTTKRFIYTLIAKDGKILTFYSYAALAGFLGFKSHTAVTDYVHGRRIHPDYEFARREIRGNEVPRPSKANKSKDNTISVFDTTSFGELGDLIKTFGQPKSVTIATLTF
jgi:hypothetical protein